MGRWSSAARGTARKNTPTPDTGSSSPSSPVHPLRGADRVQCFDAVRLLQVGDRGQLLADYPLTAGDALAKIVSQFSVSSGHLFGVCEPL